jgi:hypothetical protein
MPANEHFRCPACRAKLRFGKRPKPRVTCPSCGHQFDYQTSSEGSEPAGQTPLDPSSDALASADAKDQLGATAAFGFALKEAAGGAPHSDDAQALDLVDGEDGELPEYQPLTRRPRAKKKIPAKMEEKSGGGCGSART